MLLSALVAVFADFTLSGRYRFYWKRWAERVFQELEIDLTRLGLGRWQAVQWVLPVVITTLLVSFLNAWLLAGYSWLAVMLAAVVFWATIDLRRLLELLTVAGFLLSQGNKSRAISQLTEAKAAYHGWSSHHQSVAVDVQYVAHAAERSLRHFFVPLFCFWLGPAWLILYLGVRYTVFRQRHQYESLSSLEHYPTLAHDIKVEGSHALLSPRFILYCLEWIPTQILLFLLGLRCGLLDVMQIKRDTQSHTAWSNRANWVAGLIYGCSVQGEQVIQGTAKLERCRQLLFYLLAQWFILFVGLEVLLFLSFE